MDNSYVQQYGQLENEHWWFIIRQKIILQTLQKYVTHTNSQTLKILNVGAAAGGSSRWLSAFGEVTSLENDPLFLSYLQHQKIVVINASVTDIPLADNSFDLVCAFDVIEHVEDDKKAISELIRVCKNDGQICITVPAFQGLWGNHDVVNNHYRRYKIKSLKNSIDQQFAAILYTTYFNSMLFLPIFLVRKFRSFFNRSSKNNDSDFTYFKTNRFTNKLLKIVFGIELFLLRYIRFSFGVSLLMLLKKSSFSKANNQ